MANAWEQKGRTIDVTREQTTRVRNYFVEQAADEPTAKDAILAVAPDTLDDLPISRVSAKEIGRGYWTGTVTWGPGPEEDDDRREFEMDLTTETQRITQSLATAKYPNTTATPDEQGCINVADDGKCEGTDWFFPDAPFSCSRTLADSVVNTSFVNTLWSLVTKTNDQPYSLTIRGLTLTFQPEELLFLGCRLRRAYTEDFWSASYRFHFRKSETSLTIGGITGINKPGWRLLDVRYRRTNDAVASKPKTVPSYAYVHQVAYTGNFNLLGL